MPRLTSLVLLCVFFCTFVHADSPRNKPVVYLTFDDGPSGDSVTDELLNVLARHNAKATFFVTGERAKANPEKIRRIVGAGHVLGNHTLNHERLTSLFDHEVAAELSYTNLLVLDAGGPVMNCFRPPFGVSNSRVVDIAGSMGLRKVGWTIDTRDWDPYMSPIDVAVQLEDVTNKSVVLMHDGPNARRRTLDVFTRWIDDVGHLYSFESVPDCVEPMLDFTPMTLAVTKPVTADGSIDQSIVTLSVNQPASELTNQQLAKVVTRPPVTRPVIRPANRPVAIPSEGTVTLAVVQPDLQAVSRPDFRDLKRTTKEAIKQTVKQTVAAVAPAIEPDDPTIYGLINKLRNYKITLQR